MLKMNITCTRILSALNQMLVCKLALCLFYFIAV